MPGYLIIFLLILLVLSGSIILFFAFFGVGMTSLKNLEILEKIRVKYKTFLLAAGIFCILGSFLLIVAQLKQTPTHWDKKEKEEMVNTIMQSSIFNGRVGKDTVRLVSECFIDKYTSHFTPLEMKEHNKLSTDEISKITSVYMLECLRLYGLSKTDTMRYRNAGLKSQAN